MLKAHLTGVLINNHTEAQGYLDYCQWPHGPSLTCHVLTETLHRLQQKVSIQPIGDVMRDKMQ